MPFEKARLEWDHKVRSGWALCPVHLMLCLFACCEGRCDKHCGHLISRLVFAVQTELFMMMAAPWAAGGADRLMQAALGPSAKRVKANVKRLRR